jgi:pimeloyl-ACP methyl ester carboxylesterase
LAQRRGYVACAYAGSDATDDTDTFIAEYPGYDWSRLMRRAWAGSRVIDYLVTLPQVNPQQIAITGHSRNGKLAMMATAFDDRIALVISSSSGAGGVLSARYFSEQHFGEGIELITRVFPEWFHPRLRFFVGHEDKLPVALPDLVALAAPRPCLLSIALNDAVESSWAMEQTYLAVQQVYKLLGAQDRLRILWRPHSHETWTTIIERYLDWCDTHFGRAQHTFAERLIHPHPIYLRSATESAPNDSTPPVRIMRAGSSADWLTQRESARSRVNDMLGAAPATFNVPVGNYGDEPPHIAALLGRADPGAGVEKAQLVFGEYIAGDVYLPEGGRESSHKLPVVLWLHPAAPSNGYAAMYRRGEMIHRLLARAGYAVFCFDQIGHGRRIEEADGFYQRHPQWSLLGKMVSDARAALDAIHQLSYVDADRIIGIGYGMGAMVGLHLGALDERLAGFASVCAPPPFRTDTDEARTGGLQRWSHLHALLPALGDYIGHEEEVPYDMDELMACFAPRPLLVVSPQLDREAPVELVTHAVDAARSKYALHGVPELLVHSTPEDYNRFGPEMQQIVLDRISR